MTGSTTAADPDGGKWAGSASIKGVAAGAHAVLIPRDDVEPSVVSFGFAVVYGALAKRGLTAEISGRSWVVRPEAKTLEFRALLGVERWVRIRAAARSEVAMDMVSLAPAVFEVIVSSASNCVQRASKRSSQPREPWRIASCQVSHSR